MDKKRLFQICVLALTIIGLLAAAWPVYAADVDNALYIADVVATNSGEEATGVAVAIDVNTQALINGEYVTDNLLNTAIQTPGGSDVPFMPGVGSNPWIYWLPSVGAYESKPYMFYCGGPAMQTGFYYFPDDGGMTTDDSASLELGNNFQIEQKGYVDTSYAADKILVYKDSAFITYVSGAGEISSSIASSLSGFSSTSDGYIYATGAYAAAQAAASGTVSAGATTFKIGQLRYSSVYPTVAATNTSSQNSDSTNHTVNLPAGVASGNLLIIFFTADGNPTITFPGGWTQLFQTASGIAVKHGAWYRIADGTEGATITVTTSASEQSTHISYRITGFWGTPEAGTAATGNSVNPDSPSLTPSWGSQATLWLSDCGWDTNATETLSASPANYSNTQSRYNGSTTGCGTASAQRQLTAASENPGVWTISGAEPWVANTVAISPGYEVDRGYVYFDTSAIPDSVTISSATLYLYGQADNSTTDFDISINSGMPTYPTDPLAATDFNKTYYTNGGGSLSTSGFTTSGYNAIPLSATGLTWINKTGTTKFCLRSSRDVAITTPTGDEYVTVYAAEQTGTGQDPYLMVTYTYPIVTAEGITSGVRTVKTSADATNLVIQVYDEDDVLIDSDTAALGGASVPPNDNDWSFITNGSMPYMEYQKIWVSGTLVQHIVYERDTVFDDQTAYNNDATPTFRTTTSDPDITALFENFRPRTESEYTGGLGGGAGGMLTDTPEEPPEMYGEEGEGLSHLPGAELVETMLEEGDIPADFFWIWFCYGLAAIGVVLGYRFIRSSLLFPVIVGFAIILFFAIASGGEPIPLWTIIPYGLVSAGFIVSERVFGW